MRIVLSLALMCFLVVGGTGCGDPKTAEKEAQKGTIEFKGESKDKTVRKPMAVPPPATPVD